MTAVTDDETPERGAREDLGAAIGHERAEIDQAIAKESSRPLFEIPAWISGNLPWISAAVIAAFTVIRIITAAGFNVPSALTIVAESGVSSVATGTILTSFTLIVTAMVGMLPVVVLHNGGFNRPTVILVAVSMTLAFFVLNLLGYLLLVLVIFGVTPLSLRSLRKRRRERIERLQKEREFIDEILALRAELEEETIDTHIDAIAGRERLEQLHGRMMETVSAYSTPALVDMCFKYVAQSTLLETQESRLEKLEERINEIGAAAEGDSVSLHRREAQQLARENDRARNMRTTLLSMSIAFVYLMVALALASPAWLPRENIVTSGGEYSGYVLSTNAESEGWTAVLVASTHQVVRFKSATIQKRENCYTAETKGFLTRTPIQYLLGQQPPGPDIECRK